MTIIPLLILASLALAGVALAGFIWAVRTGQFEDIFTPSMRILTEENEKKPVNNSRQTPLQIADSKP